MTTSYYLWVDSLGQLYYSDDNAYVIRKLGPTTGMVKTIAGTNVLGVAVVK
jgi:streptogramin lyase